MRCTPWPYFNTCGAADEGAIVDLIRPGEVNPRSMPPRHGARIVAISLRRDERDFVIFTGLGEDNAGTVASAASATGKSITLISAERL